MLRKNNADSAYLTKEIKSEKHSLMNATKIIRNSKVHSPKPRPSIFL